MSVEEGLLHDVCSNPDDMAPRLVYADWLEEQGDPKSLARAEFIRVQVELAGGPDEKRAKVLRRREEELLAEWGKAWAKPVRKFFSKLTFRRGFVERATLKALTFVEHAPTFLSLTPLRHAKLRDPKDHVDRLTACPHLERLDSLSLNFGQLGMARTRAFMTSPHLGKLSALDLGNNNMAANGLRAVVDAAPRLGRLTALALDDDTVRDAGVDILAASELLGRLTDLNLQNNEITTAGARALAASPRCAGLVELNVSRNGYIGVDGVRALLSSPHLTGLRRLRLWGTGVGEQQQRALRRESRVELDFSYNLSAPY
jgi:uncharacterized protein (TIGR02996 family)